MKCIISSTNLNIKIKSYILFLNIFLVTTICASPLLATPHSMMWELKGKHNSVFILGSIHVANESFYPLSKSIEEAWRNSNIIAVEVDIASINRVEMQNTLMKYARFPNGKTLSKSVDSLEYKILKEYVNDSLKMNITLFERFKPWYVCQIITVGMIQKLGFDATQGIDLHFLERKGKRKIISLETLDSQIKVFDVVGNDSAFISYTLSTTSTSLSMVDSLMTAWKSGNVVALEKWMFMDSDVPEYQNFFQKLFYDRNGSMLSKIEKLATLKENVFVIVGAGHLISDKGIISLLKEKGHSVKRH